MIAAKIVFTSNEGLKFDKVQMVAAGGVFTKGEEKNSLLKTSDRTKLMKTKKYLKSTIYDNLGNNIENISYSIISTIDYDENSKVTIVGDTDFLLKIIQFKK